MKFDETNSAIQLAIVGNLLLVEQVILKQNDHSYSDLRSKYEQLKQSLKNPNTQTTLQGFTKDRISKEKEALEADRTQAKLNKERELDDFDRHTRKAGIRITCIALAVLALVFLLSYFGLWEFTARLFEEEVVSSFKWKYIDYSVLVAALLMSSLYLYFPYRSKSRKVLEEEHTDILENYAIQLNATDKKLAETNLKMYIAGNYLSALANLQTSITAKYYATSSFLGNLKNWFIEEKETLNNLDANMQLPFVPLLKNKTLDAYFEKNKEEIVKNISLCTSIVAFSAKVENETIAKEDLIEFQNSIKNNCVEQLSDKIKDFNVYSFLCDKSVQHDFLDQEPIFINKILEELDEKSKVFLFDNNTVSLSP